MIRYNKKIYQPKTISCKISEAQIRKNKSNEHIQQLKDNSYSLYFRYKKNRSQGTWFFYQYKDGKRTFHRLGKYPDLSATKVFNVLENYVADLSEGKRSSHNEFETVDGLLCWYLDDELRSKHLNQKRINSIKSIVDLHLIPAFHCMPLMEFDHQKIEKLLMKPLRHEQYSISYIRSIFQVLKRAFNKASNLKLISYNSISSSKFTDFVSTSVPVKGCRLLPSDVVNILRDFDNADPFARTLCLLMIGHGTRIGETRLSKWRHICFKSKQWTIPKGNTKTKKEITYPLSDEMVKYLMAFKKWQLDNHYKGNNVFPANKKDKTAIDSGRASELVRLVSLQKWSAHDLRKLARTAWADLGIDYLVAESLLNHAKGKLDQAYIHTHMSLQKKKAIEMHHEWLKNCWRSAFEPHF